MDKTTFKQEISAYTARGGKMTIVKLWLWRRKTNMDGTAKSVVGSDQTRSSVAKGMRNISVRIANVRYMKRSLPRSKYSKRRKAWTGTFPRLCRLLHHKERAWSMWQGMGRKADDHCTQCSPVPRAYSLFVEVAFGNRSASVQRRRSDCGHRRWQQGIYCFWWHWQDWAGEDSGDNQSAVRIVIRLGKTRRSRYHQFSCWRYRLYVYFQSILISRRLKSAVPPPPLREMFEIRALTDTFVNFSITFVLILWRRIS